MHIPNKINELNAAIDISDSLLSELRLLCALSDVSIKIEAEKIPVHEEVALGSELFSIPLLNLLFGSGEEFIMLFTADIEIDGAYKIGIVTDKPGKHLEITYENSVVDADSIKLFSHFG